MNFAGLFVVAELDNIIAKFIILYMPESEDEDFLEVDFDKVTEKRADKIMMAQIWLYVSYNACLMFCIKKLAADQNMWFQIPFGFLLFYGIIYSLIGAFVPIVMITYFNRSWCFMCIPKSPEVAPIEDEEGDIQMSLVETS